MSKRISSNEGITEEKKLKPEWAVFPMGAGFDQVDPCFSDTHLKVSYFSTQSEAITFAKKSMRRTGKQRRPAYLLFQVKGIIRHPDKVPSSLSSLSFSPVFID